MGHRIHIRESVVRDIRRWLSKHGGVAVWKSIDLSRPGEECLMPYADEQGVKYAKPHWRYSDDPIVVTDESNVSVYRERFYKQIPVALRRGSQGLSLKVTDASMRKVNRALAECEAKHGNAYWERGGLDNPSITITYRDGEVPLKNWRAQ